MSTVKFTATKHESDLICSIAIRMESWCKKLGLCLNRLYCAKDLELCHCNGNPLDLEGMLAASDEDLMDDVFEIRAHLNHGTGQLKKGCSPRFAMKGI